MYEASQIAQLGALRYPATYHRAARRAIVSRALEAVGAVEVDPSTWLMINENGDLYSRMSSPEYVVYRIPPRSARAHINFGGPTGSTIWAACVRAPFPKTFCSEENAGGREKGLTA